MEESGNEVDHKEQKDLGIGGEETTEEVIVSSYTNLKIVKVY